MIIVCSIDKRIFGVPLILLLQRTGQTIPTSIQTALKWLKLNALEQVSSPCFIAAELGATHRKLCFCNQNRPNSIEIEYLFN